nr:efflux RND transporter periplasmic adaptor subunit [Vampirovibrio sp.]
IIGGLIAYRMIPQGQQGFNPIFNVKTQKVTRQAIDLQYVTSGTVEADQMVDMNPEVAATVTAIYVKEGQAVQKGQPLIRLKGDRQVAQQREATAGLQERNSDIALREAELQQYNAALEAAESQKALAESEFEKYQELYKGEFISGLELEQKEVAFQTAQSNWKTSGEQVIVAQARLKQARAGISGAQARLQFNRAAAGETLIRAPFNGIVGEIHVDPGDYVLNPEALLRIVGTGGIQVRFSVPERYFSYLHPGLPIMVTPPSGRGKSFSGKVSFVDPSVNADNLTVTVKATLANTAKLRPGQFVDVRVTLDTQEGTFVVPEAALVPQGERVYVYIVNQEQVEEGEVALKATLKPVRLGIRNPGEVEIIDGLSANQQIVVDGLQKIFDGATVVVMGQQQATEEQDSEKSTAVPEDVSNDKKPAEKTTQIPSKAK